MATLQTRMIIITSDEDLIRQISLNKTANTRIVDLDQPNGAQSVDKNDHNMMDLAFLAELSTLNSNSNQVYKRALDSPHQHRAKSAKHPKRPPDLVCVICGDQAIGFNYDAPTCASCKAFFRRNAHLSREQLRCLTGDGRCSVTHQTRRKCTRCRLDRCLSAGMRKDFILSDEEKQRRRKHLAENRNGTLKQTPTDDSTPESPDEIDQLLMDLDPEGVGLAGADSNAITDTLFGTLSIEDWITIENIRSSFLSLSQNSSGCPVAGGTADHAARLVAWSQGAQQNSLLLITFFRQLDEFEHLNDDDRLHLIKFNLLFVFPVLKCFMHQASNGSSAYTAHNAADEIQHQFYTLCSSSTDLLQSVVDLQFLLGQVTERDPAVLSLLMPIVLFTNEIAIEEQQSALADELAVNRAQSRYIQLLWNYLLNRKGELETSKYFIQLLPIVFRIQKIAKMVRDFFRAQFVTSNIVNQVGPLLQIILNIS